MTQQSLTTLPASWYTSKAIGALERRAVFFKSWVLLGAVTKFPNKGVDYKHELCGVDMTVRRSEDDWRTIKIFRDSDGSEMRSFVSKTGLVFFTLSDETVSWHEFFPGLEELIDQRDFTELGLRRPLKYFSKNNWKATVDAYQECLHCAYAHPEFAKEFKPSVYKVTERHNWAQHIAGSTSGSEPGLFLYLFPNCTLSLYAGGLTCWRTSPTDEPGKARMEFDYYHKLPEGNPDFEEWYRFTRNVALEDIELCEKSQANLNVGIYNSGYLNPEKENGVVYFHNRVFELCNEQFELEQGKLLRNASLLKNNVCYITGEWAPANFAKTFEVTDPFNGEVIGHCPECTGEETKLAISAAADAFPGFSKTTGRERSKMLHKRYDLMVDNAENLSTLITWENGKPLKDARAEAIYAANFLEWFSEEAPRAYGDTIPTSVPTNRVWTVKEPIGVCGLITPWNLPAAMITRKVGPALAAGCTVVVKAPGETPFTASALAALAERVGVLPGVFNVITTPTNTPEVGEVVTTHPIIRKVSFTGSTGVGKLLSKQSSSTVKKLSIELGGNSPFIIFDDADIDAAVAGAIVAKFRSSGQTCICANRIYVHKAVYEDFVHKLTKQVEGFSVGSGFDEKTAHGPLIHERDVAKVEQHVQDAQSIGAAATCGGKKLPDLGANFFQPTVLRDMATEMAIATEETFGPVASLFPFETEEEVISLANASKVGLAGYFFTRNLDRVYRVAGALEVGMIGMNTGLISDVASPFGGVKESSLGLEGSKYGIAEYQITKAITLGGMGKTL